MNKISKHRTIQLKWTFFTRIIAITAYIMMIHFRVRDLMKIYKPRSRPWPLKIYQTEIETVATENLQDRDRDLLNIYKTKTETY